MESSLMTVRPTDSHVDRLCALMISGDACGAVLATEHALARGMSARALVQSRVLPAATTIERLHRANQLEPQAYSRARHVLRVLTRALDDLRSHEGLPEGTPQYVRFEREGTALVAHVLDVVINRQREAIVVAEIRGALKATRERCGSLVLDCSAVHQHGLASIGMILHVEREARHWGRNLAVRGLNPEGQKLLRHVRPTRRRSSQNSVIGTDRRLAAA